VNKELSWTGERLVTTVKGAGVVEHLHRYALACEFVKNKTVLDLASGEGYGSNLLSKYAKMVIGIDISGEAISYSTQKYRKDNLKFIKADATEIPIETGAIDVVVSFETLEHVSEQEKMLSEIKRVLKNDGILIISSPEKSNYEEVNLEKNPFHIKELYFDDFRQLISKYFKNYFFIFQKSIFGSLMVPEERFIDKYSEYFGDFNDIAANGNLSKPVFNLCIASDVELQRVNISFFDAQIYLDNQFKEYQNRINNLLNSKTYLAGRVILKPLRKIRKWIS